MLNVIREMDLLLIEKCKKGDRSAQQQLFNQYAPKMMAVCRRYVSNKQEAEEILLVGFTLVFSKIDQFRNEGSLESWIRKIMVNESLGFLRKRRSLFLFAELQDADGETGPWPADSDLMTEDLLELIASLPDGYRTVFNLYALDGYTHAEIAAKLGIEEATSKSQLSRARQLLRQRLDKIEGRKLKKSAHDGKSN